MRLQLQELVTSFSLLPIPLVLFPPARFDCVFLRLPYVFTAEKIDNYSNSMFMYLYIHNKILMHFSLSQPRTPFPPIVDRRQLTIYGAEWSAVYATPAITFSPTGRREVHPALAAKP